MDLQWECGLEENNYPHSWYVTEADSWVEVTTGVEKDNVRKTQIEVGFYATPDKLIHTINRRVKKALEAQRVTLPCGDRNKAGHDLRHGYVEGMHG